MDICAAISNTLKEEYLKKPNYKENWHEIANLSLSRWNTSNNIIEWMNQ